MWCATARRPRGAGAVQAERRPRAGLPTRSGSLRTAPLPAVCDRNGSMRTTTMQVSQPRPARRRTPPHPGPSAGRSEAEPFPPAAGSVATTRQEPAPRRRSRGKPPIAPGTARWRRGRRRSARPARRVRRSRTTPGGFSRGIGSFPAPRRPEAPVRRHDHSLLPISHFGKLYAGDYPAAKVEAAHGQVPAYREVSPAARSSAPGPRQRRAYAGRGRGPPPHLRLIRLQVRVRGAPPRTWSNWPTSAASTRPTSSNSSAEPALSLESASGRLCAGPFQSAPGPLAGGIGRPTGRRRCPRCVSIRPRPAGRGNRADADGRARRPELCPRRVSIRPRPAGRGNQEMDDAGSDEDKFQSAPGPLAGGIRPARAPQPPETCFNPPPARWPGESWYPAVSAGGIKFQSAPGPLAGGIRECNPPRERLRLVSIRLRPAGRGNRPFDPAIVAGSQWFQSAPGPLAGGIANPSARRAASSCFNPPPARWPGESPCDASAHSLREMFQSAPGPLAGGILRSCRLMVTPYPFQSAPGPLAGGIDTGPTGGRRGPGSFNPPPARWPGESLAQRPPDRFRRAVSIRPRPAGRGNRDVRRFMRALRVCFNPPPARWPGESLGLPSRDDSYALFQSAPGPLAGGISVEAAVLGLVNMFQSAPGPLAGGIRS